MEKLSWKLRVTRQSSEEGCSGLKAGRDVWWEMRPTPPPNPLELLRSRALEPEQISPRKEKRASSLEKCSEDTMCSQWGLVIVLRPEVVDHPVMARRAAGIRQSSFLFSFTTIPHPHANAEQLLDALLPNIIEHPNVRERGWGKQLFFPLPFWFRGWDSKQ